MACLAAFERFGFEQTLHSIGKAWMVVVATVACINLFDIHHRYVPKNLLEVPSVSPTGPPLAAPDLLLLADLPLVHKRIAIFENVTSTESGAHAPPSGLAQPPLSPHACLQYCCKPNLVLKQETYGSHYAYPILLDHLLLDVSQNRNWNIFLDELALELGLQVSRIERINFNVLSLSRLNISMTMVPQGISFSANEASAINSSLVILFIAIIAMFVRCLRTFRPGKTKTSPVEIDAIIHLTLSLWCTSL